MKTSRAGANESKKSRVHMRRSLHVLFTPDSTPEAFTRSVRWTQRVLFAGALSLIGYCGVAVTDALTTQALERRELDRQIAGRRAATDRAPRTTSSKAVFRWASAAAGDLVGRIDIPRLNVSAMVMEGTGTATLRRGVGHIPGTALPGEYGNVGLSAHRDTFFRPLRNIQRNDVVTLTTLLGEYRYRVVSTKVVDPNDVTALNSGARQTLTLITCYPFYFVGPARHRFVVRAERIEDGS